MHHIRPLAVGLRRDGLLGTIRLVHTNSINSINSRGGSSGGIRRNHSASRDEDGGVLARISQLSEILANEKSSYTEKSLQCYEYYRKGKLPDIKTKTEAESPASNFLQDILRYREINTDVIRRICHIYTKNSSMRAFLLQEIAENMRQLDFAAVLSTFELMNESQLLLKTQAQRVSQLQHLINRLRAEIHRRERETAVPGPPEIASTQNFLLVACNLLLSVCVQSGESILAVVLAHECVKICPEIKERVEVPVMQNSLVALSVYDPVMHHYKSYALFKMLLLFSAEVLTRTYLKMLLNMSVDAKNPFFVNSLYDRVAQDLDVALLRSHERALFLQVLKQLVAVNLHHGNVYRAAELWVSAEARLAKVLEPEGELCKAHSIWPDFVNRNSMLLEALLQKCNGPEVRGREQIIKELLRNVDLEEHPRILDFALTFYGENACTEFEDLVKLLKPPLGRSTLSALFSALLAQNKEKAAERIMQTIFRTQRGLNSSDFDDILKKLLSQHKLQECLDMFRDTNFAVASKGTMRLLTYLLQQKRKMAILCGHKVTQEKQAQFKSSFDDFVASFTEKMHLAGDGTRQLMTITLFRFCSRYINNRVSRRIYERRGFEEPKNTPANLDLELLQIPRSLEQFVRIDITNRVTCLLVIMNQALADADQSVVAWAARELQRVGVPLSDIEGNFMKTIHG